MPKQFTYRDLIVWKQGMDLAEQCYKATTSFPKSELSVDAQTHQSPERLRWEVVVRS